MRGLARLVTSLIASEGRCELYAHLDAVSKGEWTFGGEELNHQESKGGHRET